LTDGGPASTFWRPAGAADASARITRLGGQPSWSGVPRWPLFRGEPLPFLGQVVLPTGEVVLIFMSSGEDSDDWRAEGGGNAALVEPGGGLPEWITARPVASGPTTLPNGVLVPPEPLVIGGEPEWLQHDETPAAAPVFVCQFDGFPEPDGWIAFGDGGSAYLFVSEDRMVARFLWQC
jgi:hypothetical protein